MRKTMSRSGRRTSGAKETPKSWAWHEYLEVRDDGRKETKHVRVSHAKIGGIVDHFPKHISIAQIKDGHSLNSVL
jgi:hypothetical protein